MSRVLAVDGDIVAYRTAAVCESHFEGACNDIVDRTMSEIAGDTGITQMRVYLSGKHNFRRFIGTTLTYKGNRDTMTRPQYLSHCLDRLKERYGAISIDGYEADDLIATDMTANGAIHCGVDKDINQIAGQHYNYVNKEWHIVTPEQATINLYRQVLMGDTSDNVPGLPKIGEVKSAAAIQNHATAFDDALAYYRATCAKLLPDIDAARYFIEQYGLIAMICKVPMQFNNTVTVQPWMLSSHKKSGKSAV
jgi:hypothetical protein